ncbi:ExeA family protein [Rubrivivax gelatinosus]|uniref:Type II secretion system protein A n=1 Tax=Rubrivivax gelatinosus TaxID=28068 RepID=A0A4R2MFJ4_RUBGE|nr:AAA family ATPase [Rubrivivax gelatinosus]MBK1689068.1 peptidoglycan-binding protein [Rubrivivax gelatinosus]TCP05181.1 type II secretion system protein A [Rubrivivax gelatinosus]
MYASFYGLQREPFSIAPDPRFLYMSEAHREALAHLLYGLSGGGGFVLLTGEIGAGKTTVCRCFLEQVPSHCDVAYVFNPKLDALELLQTVCDEFRLEVPAGAATVKAYVDALNRFLLAAHAAGRHAVLVIDEAQALAPEVLEQLRLLTNLETDERKLLQIVLIGQPELRTMLARPELEQLAQRVIARYHLPALDAAETAAYVRHRLAVAGLAGDLPFDDDAIAALHRLCGGVPRRINLLADRALLGGYARGQRRVGRAVVERAAHEVFGTAPAAPAPSRAPVVAAVLGVAALAVGALVWQAGRGDATAAEAGPVLPAALPAAAAASAAVVAAAAPAASAPVAEELDAEALLARAAAREADGVRALAARWKVQAGAGEPCSALAATGLACWRTKTGLAQVRDLGRPGLLTLHGSDGRSGVVLLTGLDSEHATLAFADGGQATVDLATLATLWRGEFATLWRPPPGWGSPGDPTVLAAWLDERLPGRGTLAPRIVAFQVAHGLQPDGRAGPLTLMQILRTDGDTVPRLALTR